MDTLPEDIQKTIYKYKHQIEFTNVMVELKGGVCYCGWCGSREVLNTRLMMDARDQKQMQVMEYYMSAGLSRGQAWLKWVEYMRSNPEEFASFDYTRH